MSDNFFNVKELKISFDIYRNSIPKNKEYHARILEDVMFRETSFAQFDLQVFPHRKIFCPQVEVNPEERIQRQIREPVKKKLIREGHSEKRSPGTTNPTISNNYSEVESNIPPSRNRIRTNYILPEETGDHKCSKKPCLRELNQKVNQGNNSSSYYIAFELQRTLCYVKKNRRNLQSITEEKNSEEKKDYNEYDNSTNGGAGVVPMETYKIIFQIKNLTEKNTDKPPLIPRSQINLKFTYKISKRSSILKEKVSSATAIAITNGNLR
ncbi:2381_t:CDS:2 [Funneliformis geosporum]|nr:2381_t:CDS:2 [Funneliformis geosporum]